MWILRDETIRTIRPVKRRDTFRWIVDNIRTPDGKPFNPFDYPWVEGICQAWDMPDVRQITMQFAARLGKTFTANSLLISALEHDPAIGMLGLPTETLLREMIRDKYYKMLDRCLPTQKLVPDIDSRSQLRIDLTNAIVYGAWAGSPTSLADKAPKYKHAGEVSKFTKAKSDEADPLDLFLERGIEIPDRKTIVESTPSIEGACRVERHLKNGWNCRFLIPCPKCKKRIELITGDGEKGGIVFDKLPDGTADDRLARTTGRYRCQECGAEWGDESRKEAIQRGIWVPEGQTVDSRGRLVGTMVGAMENASFQLSRIYAPTFTFGDIAAEVARCIRDPARWHNYFNSWGGLTYRRRRATKEWNEVGERLAMSYQKGTVPIGGIFLTCGVDVQQDHYVYVIVAWGHDSTGWIVDYGTAFSEAELKGVIQGRYPHADGGPPSLITRTLIDAGEGVRQDEIIDLCRVLNNPKGPWVWPSKGSSGALQGGRPFRDLDLEDLPKRRTHQKRKSITGFKFISVNTPFFQSWIQSALHYRKPNTPKSLAIPSESGTDEDFLRQMVNEKPEDTTDSTGHSQTKWVVVDQTCPWDFRDATRYARCAAEVFTRGAWQRLPRQRIMPKHWPKQEAQTRSHGTQNTVTPKKAQTQVSKAGKSKSDPAKPKSGFIRQAIAGFLRK